jgi:hypothetical protein
MCIMRNEVFCMALMRLTFMTRIVVAFRSFGAAGTPARDLSIRAIVVYINQATTIASLII